MDVSIAKDWLAVVATVLSLGGFLYTWLTHRSTENSGRLQAVEATLIDRKTIIAEVVTLVGGNAAKLAQVEKKLVEDDRRIQSIESDLKHMPDHEQIAGIRIAITKLDGGFQRVEDLIGAQARSLQRVEKHLFDDHKNPRG